MDSVKVGKIISSQRKELNMTQQQLADILKVSNKSISRWETGVTMPDISLLLPLCDALNISVDDLLSGRLTGEINTRKSIEQAIKNRRRNRIIMTFMILAYFVMIYMPWGYEVSMYGKYGLYVAFTDVLEVTVVAALSVYLILIYMFDQKNQWVFVASLALLVGLYCRYITGFTILIEQVTYSPRTCKIGFLGIFAMIYGLVMIGTHFVLFRKRKDDVCIGLRTEPTVNRNKLYWIMVIFAVFNILAIEGMPLLYGPQAVYMIFGFVEREPYRLGNFIQPDMYHGVFLTWGSISLWLCPFFALLARYEKKILYFLSNFFYIHILICTFAFRYRFPTYATAEPLKQNFYCLIPIVGLVLYNYLYFKRIFIREK